MTEEIINYYNIMRRNFPFIIREKETILRILSNKDNIIICRKDSNNGLIAVSVINHGTILLLCVDLEYRNQGIGSGLLKESEDIIAGNGYNKITAGAGFDYIMPGVPLARSYYKAGSKGLCPYINNNAADFFTKRGYIHSCNCDFFDMKISLKDFTENIYNTRDNTENIIYRWATPDDIDNICECTDDAYQDFTKYYKDNALYSGCNNPGVLAAFYNNEACGTLIVRTEDMDNDIGSFGCLTVKHAYQGKHIAINLIKTGTKYLKDAGLKEAFIGYTYSGLDYLYGQAGYKPWIYYMMAEKEIHGELWSI